MLQLPSRPQRPKDPEEDPAEEGGAAGSGRRGAVRAGRYGDLEEHELIHLLDSLDDERAKARFRESVYISIIIWLAIAWFLFYGPRILFHQPRLVDPIALMKEHDREITLTMPPHPPTARPAPKLDRKTMDRLQRQAPRPPAPTAPATPAPVPPPQQASVTPPTPPVAAPALPVAPRPSPTPEAALPAAPSPRIAQNGESARDALRDAARGSRGGSGADTGALPGLSGPVHAGAEILSDTQGVDFNAYLRRVVSDTKRNWEPLIPEEVQPPLLKRGIVGIRFTILSDGEIGNMVLETRSGDEPLDKAAWNAITSEGQFPPLPREFHGPQIELRFTFLYNEQIP